MFGASQTAEAAAGPSRDADSRAVRQLSWLILAGLACTVFIVGFLVFAAVQAVSIIDAASIARERVQVSRAIAAAPGGMNEITLHAMGESLDLIDARLTSADQRRAGEEMVLIYPGSDRVVAWTPHRLGSLTFQTVAPLRIVAGVVFVAIVGLIGWRVHVVGRGLDNSRLAAAERAKTDPLTGLGNRLAFDAALSAHYDDVETGGPGFVLVTLDLDGFKAINDANGHAAGDAVLRAVADILRQIAGPTDVIARIGGDEFAVVRSATGLDRYLDALMVRLARPVAHDGQSLKIGASAGIARSEDYASPVRICAAADAALYRAKRNGRGTAELAVPSHPPRRFAA